MWSLWTDRFMLPLDALSPCALYQIIISIRMKKNAKCYSGHEDCGINEKSAIIRNMNIKRSHEIDLPENEQIYIFVWHEHDCN